MSFIFKLLVLAQPGFHRQGGLGALEGLDAGLFIGTDQMNPLLLQRKGATIQGTDFLAVLIKRFFIRLPLWWVFPIAHVMRL